MRIGYFIGAAASDTDGVLRMVARELMDCGLEVCGVIQTNDRKPGTTRCDMVVHVLPHGPNIGISQTLGSSAGGCRLDTDALERAVAATQVRLSGNTGVLLLNKFGRREAEGKGFRPVVAEAVSLGIPVLLKVNPLNLKAFSSFSAGHAELLEPNPLCLANWVLPIADREASNRIVSPKT